MPVLLFFPNHYAVKAQEGLFLFLNIGCGTHFSAEWNNIDLLFDDHIMNHDVSRRPLPYRDNTFHAVYTSHLLKTLWYIGARTDAYEGGFRVLNNEGVCRVVVQILSRSASSILRMAGTFRCG